MSSHWQKTVGPNHVPSYQMAGIPFVTSSAVSEVSGVETDAAASPEPIAIKFPFVTNFVTIRNTGVNELRVGFSVRGMFAPGERLPASVTGGTAVKPGLAHTDSRNYFLIPSASGGNPVSEMGARSNGGTTQTFNIRCKEIFFVANTGDSSPAAAGNSTDFSLMAGLTMIPAGEFWTLTGSVESGGTTIELFDGIG
jgi:hypothetical protein